jgi:exodeoxyribonuclease-3
MSNTLFKVATLNANSIRSRIEQVLEWLKRETPDILCLQETKVQDKDFPTQPILHAGFNVAFRGQKSHAGVAIISKKELQNVAFGLDDGGEPDEARLIRATTHDIPVVNTYVPQGRDPESHHFKYKLKWFGRLRELFNRQYTPRRPLLWVGDFNVAPEPIDIHDPKRLKDHVDFHPEARAALENVRSWGFVDLFRLHHPDEPGQYTYWDYRVRGAIERGLGWRVDHIWATKSLAQKCTRAWIDVEARKAERPSDHTFLIAEFVL